MSSSEIAKANFISIGCHILKAYFSERRCFEQKEISPEKETDIVAILFKAIKARLAESLTYGLRVAKLSGRRDLSYMLKTQINGWKLLQVHAKAVFESRIFFECKLSYSQLLLYRTGCGLRFKVRYTRNPVYPNMYQTVQNIL